jgi:hypothetical protein
MARADTIGMVVVLCHCTQCTTHGQQYHWIHVSLRQARYCMCQLCDYGSFRGIRPRNAHAMPLVPIYHWCFGPYPRVRISVQGVSRGLLDCNGVCSHLSRSGTYPDTKRCTLCTKLG